MSFGWVHVYLFEMHDFAVLRNIIITCYICIARGTGRRRPSSWLYRSWMGREAAAGWEGGSSFVMGSNNVELKERKTEGGRPGNFDVHGIDHREKTDTNC